MRLTLRTLLALRDGVLDRNAAVELQQRLQQSGTAQAIAYRIDAVVGDRKLNPLAVDERATGLDANDVAQFLDGTMQPDRVPGMERKCLDHNALLAEIAAVHQVLSRAMHEPVTIHPSLRTRLYGLKSKLGPGTSPTVPAHHASSFDREHPVLAPHADPTGLHRTTAPSHRTSSPAAPSRSPVTNDELDESHPSLVNGSNSGTDRLVDSVLVEPSRTNRELGGTGLELDDSLGKQVPEYLLVKQRGRWTSWGKPALLTSLLLLSTTLAIGPWDRISKLLSPDPTLTPAAQNKSLRRSELPTDLAQAKSRKPDALDAPAPTIDPAASATTEPMPTDAMPTDALQVDDMPVDVMPIDLPAIATESITANPTAREPNAAPTQQATLSPPGIEVAILWKAPPDPDSLVALAHRDPLSQSWQWRLNRRDAILDGAQQMTFLPHTVGELISPSGMRWLVSDDTQLEWIPNASNTPRVRIITRNALARPSANSKRLQLELEAGILEILFDSDSSLAGIETVDHHVSIDANTSPPEIQAHWTTRVTAVEGSLKVRWLPPQIAPNNAPSTTETPSNTTWSLKKSEQIEATGIRIEPPHLSAAEWSPGASQPSLMAAAAVLRGLLSGGVFPVRDTDPTLPAADGTADARSDWKPVLEAMAANPDPMVAATALRGQIQLGQFLHLFGTDGVFRRPELNPHWPLILDQLFRSLANPETHPVFLDAIRAQTAERYSQILPLIAFPTNAELASGRDKALVAGLSDSLIDVRALAIHQLKRITDDPLGYDAMSPSAESVQRWKSALLDETIRIPAAAPGAPQETR
jgi:hypothetical protein